MLSIGRFGTRDIERAKGFYDGIASVLGAQRMIDRPDMVGYRGADGGMFIVGKPFEGDATAGNGTQLGFMAPDREAVDKAHARALELGGKCEGPPGFRGPEEMGFYA